MKCPEMKVHLFLLQHHLGPLLPAPAGSDDLLHLDLGDGPHTGTGEARQHRLRQPEGITVRQS